MKHRILLLPVFALICSCNFNKGFYQGDKIPAGAKKVTLTSKAKDSTWKSTISFGEQFQPTFADAEGNTLPLDYSVESVLFENSRGNKINGWFVMPKGKVATVSVLLLHGNGGNVVSQFPGAKQLALQGFNVFLIDYSGYGFSEGRATRKGVLDDATTALKVMSARPDVKGTKIVVYGQSLGGHLSATVARDNEAMVDALVIEGAFSSHKDVAAHMFRPLAPVARVIVREGYKAYRSVEDFHKPVLVIHSTEDETIPFRMGKKIYNHANEPKSFYEIRHGHIEGLTFYADSIGHKIRRMVESKGR